MMARASSWFSAQRLPPALLDGDPVWSARAYPPFSAAWLLLRTAWLGAFAVALSLAAAWITVAAGWPEDHIAGLWIATPLWTALVIGPGLASFALRWRVWRARSLVVAVALLVGYAVAVLIDAGLDGPLGPVWSLASDPAARFQLAGGRARFPRLLIALPFLLLFIAFGGVLAWVRDIEVQRLLRELRAGDAAQSADRTHAAATAAELGATRRRVDLELVDAALAAIGTAVVEQPERSRALTQLLAVYLRASIPADQVVAVPAQGLPIGVAAASPSPPADPEPDPAGAARRALTAAMLAAPVAP